MADDGFMSFKCADLGNRAVKPKYNVTSDDYNLGNLKLGPATTSSKIKAVSQVYDNINNILNPFSSVIGNTKDSLLAPFSNMNFEIEGIPTLKIVAKWFTAGAQMGMHK